MGKTQIFNPKYANALETEERKLWENPDKILGLVEIKPDFTAVDLGCGSGFFTLPLAKRAKKVYAIDLQEEMLRIIEQKMRKQKIKNIKPLLSRENEIPLKDKSVEFLVSVNALHEFGNTKRMIKEVHRVLKPKGKALIVDFKKEETVFGPPVAIRISKEQAITLFEKNGFKTLKTMNLPFHYALVFSK